MKAKAPRANRYCAGVPLAAAKKPLGGMSLNGHAGGMFSMKHLRIALQFLTALPFKIQAEIKDEDYAKSLIYFPVVGIFIGTILAIVALGYLFLPLSLVAAILLVVSTGISAALHLDGFADTCDGFYGAKAKEEILKIMRDPRIGVMGVIGISLLLLLKFSLLVSIPRATLWRALILMGCFSRWLQAVSCLLPYAREEGKARLFIQYARKKDIMIAGLVTLFVSCALFALKGVFIFFTALIPAILFMRYAKAKIGGMTGDTIGAVNEIAEASTLFSTLIFGSLWS
jgi:adenosylcobinamide-GDP ribazoletransferase